MSEMYNDYIKCSEVHMVVILQYSPMTSLIVFQYGCKLSSNYIYFNYLE